jgi:hypothetical protein
MEVAKDMMVLIDVYLATGANVSLIFSLLLGETYSH